MPKYLVQANYVGDGVKGLINEGGSSRRAAVEKLFESVGGKLEAGPGFPTDPATAKAGKVEAKADVFLPVRSLKSVKEDGSAYSSSMDDIMYEKLQEQSNKLIKFKLTEMVLKEGPAKADAPLQFDTKGELTVAGATKEIAMPVTMKVDGKRLEFSGQIKAKMTDFKVEPVSALGGTIKTNMIGIDPDPAGIELGMDIEVTYGIAPRKDGEGNEYMTYWIKPQA